LTKLIWIIIIIIISWYVFLKYIPAVSVHYSDIFRTQHFVFVPLIATEIFDAVEAKRFKK